MADPDTNSIEKAKLKNIRLERIGYIVGIVASIIFAAFSYFKEEKESTAREVYKELAAQQEQASKERVQLQKDLAAIRGYLAAKADRPALFNLFPDEDKEEKVAVIKPPKIGVRPLVHVETAAPVKVAAVPAEKEEKLPELKSKPVEYKAPSVEEVAQAAEK